MLCKHSEVGAIGLSATNTRHRPLHWADFARLIHLDSNSEQGGIVMVI